MGQRLDIAPTVAPTTIRKAPMVFAGRCRLFHPRSERRIFHVTTSSGGRCAGVTKPKRDLAGAGWRRVALFAVLSARPPHGAFMTCCLERVHASSCEPRVLDDSVVFGSDRTTARAVRPTRWS